MTTKYDVIRVHREHPDWCSAEIGRELDCHQAYVRATAQRNGLRLPNKMRQFQTTWKWTEERVAELRAMYRAFPKAVVAKHFGLTMPSLYVRAHLTGASRPNSRTPSRASSA